MLEFAPNTYMLEYQNGAYLCNGTKQIEAPLNLETLEEAVRQCPKLQQVLIKWLFRDKVAIKWSHEAVDGWNCDKIRV